MAQRLALIVTATHYRDRTLAQPDKPQANAAALASVLGDPAIGAFTAVETSLDQPAHVIRQQIGDLFHRRRRHDLLLLYFSGLGVRDEAGRLYLAAVDTSLEALAETGIPAAFVSDWMDRSFARQQILILDCDYLGLPGRETSNAPGTSAGAADAFRGKGYWRIVLAATDTIRYGLDGRELRDRAAAPGFTAQLVRGLETGAADLDGDGQIGVRELFAYARAELSEQPGNHRPRLWTHGERDRFILAHNPRQVEPARPIKWDLVFGAILAPTATVVIGGQADFGASLGMAGMILLLYALLYRILD